MFEKYLVVLAYATTGLAIALWPVFLLLGDANRQMRATRPAGLESATPGLVKTLCLGLSLIGLPILVVFSTATTAPLVGFVLLCAATAIVHAFYQGKFSPLIAMLAFASLMLSSTLIWWKRGQLSWFDVLAFAAVTMAILAIQRSRIAGARSLGPVRLQYVLFLVAVIAISFTTTTLHGENLLVAWHHWGAYIGSSELLLAGARVFLDVPVQYGLGPVSLIAAACRTSCWEGMYFLVGLTTALFAVSIAALAIATVKSGCARRTPRALVLLLCIVCVFFWSGYPAALTLPIATPSASGLRFLPITLFVLLLVFLDQRFQHDRRVILVGHLAWGLVSLWSPESGFYATCVWWPYYILLRCSAPGSRKARILNFFSAIVALVVVAFFLVAFFVCGYWLAYGVTPSAAAYFAYALNPPGTMAIDPNGAVLFFAGMVALATVHNWQVLQRAGNTAAFRRGLLLLLLAYSTFSYFLGRSHDNNILNLMPFTLLVLLNVQVTSTHHAVRATAMVLLATLLGWTSTFGLTPQAKSSEGLIAIKFSPSWVSAAISAERADGPRFEPPPFPPDAARALSQIRHETGESVTIFPNRSWNGVSTTSSAAVWSAFHSPANLALFPSKARRTYLARTARTLNRSGWLVVPKAAGRNALVDDFDWAYERTEERDFGTYQAIRYQPKN